MKIEEYASNKIRGEMRSRKITTGEICARLKEVFDISLNIQSFNNKMSRGGFNAAFFFQCMYVLDVKLISFDKSDIEVDKKEDLKDKI